MRMEKGERYGKKELARRNWGEGTGEEGEIVEGRREVWTRLCWRVFYSGAN